MSFRIESECDPSLARSRILTHGDAQFTWMQGSASGDVRMSFRKDTLRGS
jgi:hypothetical protein